VEFVQMNEPLAADASATTLTGAGGKALRPQAGLMARMAHQIRRHPIGFMGMLIVLFVLLMALFAPLIAPFEPSAQAARRLLPPSSEHIMGTDELGRDVLSRIIFGARTSLYVGLLSVSIASFLGISVGVLAGFIGGNFDNIIMRFVDIVSAFPTLVLAIVIAGLLGPSLTNAMIAIAIVFSPNFARVSRGSVLTVKNEVYLDAARVIGGKQGHIIMRHILPNIMAPLVILATLSLSVAILAEASLSFLGLGTQPPNSAWGLMLSQGRRFMELSPGLAIFPGLAIMITVLAFNFLGDGLRDALDPRLRL
jgi:peptide/nickel transport system permease protein